MRPDTRGRPLEPTYTIRDARTSDIETLIDFTVREAREAEGKELNPEGVARGVRAAFESPPRATYWIAQDAEGRAVASTSVVREWSNFHGADYWWVQSLFIAPEHRGSGLAALLLDHLAHAAAAGGALDLRLYAHASNERAMRAYRRHGFAEAPYVIMNRRARAAR